MTWIDCGDETLISDSKVKAAGVIPVAVHTTAILTLMSIQGWAIYRKKHGVVTMIFTILLIICNAFGIAEFAVLDIKFVSLWHISDL